MEGKVQPPGAGSRRCSFLGTLRPSLAEAIPLLWDGPAGFKFLCLPGLPSGSLDPQTYFPLDISTQVT
jgi:hypothetical protein